MSKYEDFFSIINYLRRRRHPEQSCVCPCKCCPCKLKETDFSKDPIKMDSKHLPRGPFFVDGHIVGPLRIEKESKFVVADRQLYGVFELRSDSDCDTKTESENNKNVDKTDRATWIPKENINNDKETNTEPNKNNKINFLLTDDELNIRRVVHDKSTCKYCGFIHYLLNAETQKKKQNSSNGSEKIGYWPQQFEVRADIHKENAWSSKNSSRSYKPTASSTPASLINRKPEEQSLNLALSSIHPVKQTLTKSSDNYFETKIPIYLKDFKGEVKTGIEVFKKNKVDNHQIQEFSNPLEPLVVVATEVKIHKI